MSDGKTVIVNSQGRPVANDEDSSAQVGITFPHWKSHLGTLCTATNKNTDVDIAKPAYWMCRPPAGKEAHISALIYSTGAGEAMLFRNAVTLPTGGTVAFALINEARIDMVTHLYKLARHLLEPGVGYPPAQIFNTEPLTIPQFIALTNWILLAYKLHNADMAAAVPVYHSAQGADHALASEVDATTFAEACTLLNDIKAKYNLHEAESVGHKDVGTVAADQIAATDSNITGMSEYGSQFLMDFRNNLSNLDPVMGAFFYQPEVKAEGSQIETIPVPGGGVGANKFGGSTREGAEIVVPPLEALLIKFLPDADNAKAWFVCEYYDVAE